ncbi:DUF6710 family protein [Terasakiella sp. SH-1]|uniref:DUF6710 family protein n=1 Tax=Terasakiella sp. SH-1 TaxID=2560057 RepID=UPI0010741A44|nr:DUF6710 family protein [Terasakiella sp. SH-1]
MKNKHLKSMCRKLLQGVADTRGTLSNQQVFQRIMKNVAGRDLAYSGDKEDRREYFHDKEYLLRIVRILASPLQDALIARMWLAAGELDTYGDDIDIGDLFLPYHTKWNNENLTDKAWRRGQAETMRLGIDPVLVWPWRHSRLYEVLALIGENRPYGEWEQDDIGHDLTVVMPVRIGVLGSGGNHSIATGIAMRTGEVKTKNAYDLSVLYPIVHSDGRGVAPEKWST